MKVAFATPELLSLVRRTNLAGVAESMARSLHEAGADVRVFLPRTVDVDTSMLEDLTPIGTLSIPDKARPSGGRTTEVSLSQGRLPLGGQPTRGSSGSRSGLAVVLIEEPKLFGERHPYGGSEGPYADNWRRYALFARAVLEAFDPLGFEPDVIHCFDWTTGLIPLFHQVEYVEAERDHPATRAGTWFAINNLAMQGAFEREILPKIDVPHSCFRGVGGLELDGKVNFLKAGAEFATVIGTHSPSHAEKIQERDRGYGLEDVFQRRTKELVGISNGIDYSTWDPSSDPVLPANFSARDRDPTGKRRCKAHLQELLKLDSGPRTPIACHVGRWDADSGFDLLAEILTPVLERGIELVVIGAGQSDVQQRLKTMESTFMGRMRVVDGFEARMAHLTMAAADILLLPSHYQPSNPLFAVGMRYGAVPLVYARSGLEDVVVPATENAGKGTGLHFEPYTADGLLDGIERAQKLYKNASNWKKLMKRCLGQDFSWEATAKEYLKAYRRVKRRTKARLEV